jgi:tetratricopeptide (TPR) repeat protein
MKDLVDREWLRPRRSSRLAGEVEYEFRHALVREAAYATLTDEDRRVGHRLAALWLEKAGERDAAALAEHFQRGDDPSRAVECYLRAAEQALEGDDLPMVIARAERGIACGAEGEMLGRLRLLQAEAHNWRGEYQSGAERGAEAMALLQEAGTASGTTAVGYWAEAVNHANWAAARLGEYAQVQMFADVLLQKAQNERAYADARVVVALAHVAGWQAELAGASARSIVNWLKDNAEAIGTRDPLVAATIKQAYASHERGNRNFAEAARLFDAMSDDLSRAGHRRLQHMAWCNAANLQAILGNYERAEILARDSLALAERLSLPDPFGRGVLGFALAHLGDSRTGESFLQQGAAEARTQGDRPGEAGARIWLCRVMMIRGDHEAAAEQASMAVTLAEGAPVPQAYALGVLASALLAQHRASAAITPARKAFEIVEALGGIEDGDAFVRLVHAETLDALGDHAAAREVLRAAHERLVACAARIDDHELRRSFLERVPENARTLELARSWFPS